MEIDMSKVFETFYQQCDVKKEIQNCSIMLKDDNPSIRVIKDETTEEVIKVLMLKSFAKRSYQSFNVKIFCKRCGI
jgi:hypothetical protein